MSTPKKSGGKSGKRAGTFEEGKDPRRGKGPKPGTGGRPPNEFKAHMQAMLDDAKADAYLLKCLRGEYGPRFALAAREHAADRAYGKATQGVELTSYEFNPDDFTDEGLDRVADGEDPVHVLATGGRLKPDARDAP